MKRKLVALCACPMGLAHTFMAAEALEQAAKEMGYEYKVETQGSDGIQGELSGRDIEEADVIIHSVAVTPNGIERFEGYEVYEASLQEIIRNARGVLKEIEEDQGIN
ncbi:PTS fructose transporter subunit IIB [Proteiniclasticum ruminis]|uniref:PTS system IIB component, Fru family n=1 Tax=Proteiniclasticum ruminis TaxID=398199 RepID=A0A1I5C897_9CLOT|nr:PTS fructose transporter subunit IIB [Proteiniclasticum ruminis]SFN82891.1 PTS system IIB component, Fru family [Proteiniclasticum ruminis]